MTAATAECRVDPGSGIVLFQSEDHLSYAEWERAVRAAWTQTGGHIRLALSDRRQLSRVYPPGLIEAITEFVLAHEANFAGARWALLMRDDAAAHTAANAAMPLMEALQIKVYTALRPALAWLLESPEAPDLERLERWVEGA